MTTSHGMLIYQNDITPDTLVDMKGDRKIIEEVSGIMPNASLFKLTKEDHTIANLLRMKLHESPYVQIAGYRVPHPTQHRVELRVQTASAAGAAAAASTSSTAAGSATTTTTAAAAAAAAGSGTFAKMLSGAKTGGVPTPKEALQAAIDGCLADLQTFEEQLRAEAQAKGLEVNEE